MSTAGLVSNVISGKYQIKGNSAESFLSDK